MSVPPAVGPLVGDIDVTVGSSGRRRARHRVRHLRRRRALLAGRVVGHDPEVVRRARRQAGHRAARDVADVERRRRVAGLRSVLDDVAGQVGFSVGVPHQRLGRQRGRARQQRQHGDGERTKELEGGSGQLTSRRPIGQRACPGSVRFPGACVLAFRRFVCFTGTHVHTCAPTTSVSRSRNRGQLDGRRRRSVRSTFTFAIGRPRECAQFRRATSNSAAAELCVISAADCPLQNGTSSTRPCASAACFSAATRCPWKGYGKRASDGESSTSASALRSPRPSRPVKPRVSSVPSPCAALRSAARWAGCAFDSSQARNAVPICTAWAPSASAAAMPRPSAIPPAAMTGARTASATCGTSATVPIKDASADRRKEGRWPPASAPVATMASTPAASSARASSTVVAVPMVRMPCDRQRSRIAGGGTPKMKLTIGGRASISAAACSSNTGSAAGGNGGGALPSAANSGASDRGRRVVVGLADVLGAGVRGRHPQVDGEGRRRQRTNLADDGADAIRRHPLRAKRAEATGVRHDRRQAG